MMAPTTLDACSLDRVRVAPGRIVVNGEHYSYADHTFTIEQVGGRHFVIVVGERERPVAPSWWQRFTGLWYS